MSALNKTSKFLKFGIVTFQLGAVVLALYEAYKKLQATKSLPKHYDSDLKNKFSEDKRDIVEETSLESFPASDPPASNRFT